MNDIKDIVVVIICTAVLVCTAQIAPAATADENVSMPREARVLLGQLFSNNLRKRLNAVIELGNYDYPRVREGLIMAVQRDADVMVKKTAIRKLGELKADEAASVILENINSAPTALKIEAIKAGVKLSSAPVNRAVMDQINSDNPLVRQTAINAVAEIDKDLLKKEDIFKIIIGRLKDNSTGVRVAACTALGEHSVKEALPELIDVLENDSSQIARRKAAQVIGEIGGKEVSEELVEALKQQYPRVRIEAALALAKLGSAEGLNEAIDGIKSEDYRVRVQACRIIGLVGDESMSFLLQEAKNDFDNRVKKAAREALKKLTSKTKEKN